MSLSADHQSTIERVVLVTIYDKNLFDAKHLALLAKLHQELAGLGSVKKISSLYTAPDFGRFLQPL